MSGRTGTGEKVEDDVVGFGGNFEATLDEADRFRVTEICFSIKISLTSLVASWLCPTSLYFQIVIGVTPFLTSERKRFIDGTFAPSSPNHTRLSAISSFSLSSENTQDRPLGGRTFRPDGVVIV
jgi:hypothetical protein